MLHWSEWQTSVYPHRGHGIKVGFHKVLPGMKVAKGGLKTRCNERKKGSNTWRKEAKNWLIEMKCCRGLVCRGRFCRGSHLCINWDNKNLCIELHVQLSERFKSCNENQGSKSTSGLKRAQVTTRLSQLTYLVHLTVSQRKNQGADGSTAWYITLGPVFSEQNQMFLRMPNILQTPGCCRSENVTVPWTEICVWLKFQKGWQQCFFKGSSFPLWTFLSPNYWTHSSYQYWALFPWHRGFSGVEPRPSCTALAVQIKP